MSTILFYIEFIMKFTFFWVTPKFSNFIYCNLQPDNYCQIGNFDFSFMMKNIFKCNKKDGRDIQSKLNLEYNFKNICK